MGKKDLWQSDYFDKNDRFADIFNSILFGGNTVISPDELSETDGEIISTSETGSMTKVIRDKVKRWHGGYLSILSLENQSYVDYRMVFRIMKEEALGYEKQWKDQKHNHQLLEEHLDGHEFVSGIKKNDKFVPIITLVLYFGTDKAWDGAERLHEMLDIADELKPFVPEYKINVFDYHRYTDFSNFGQENRLLFELLSASDDKTKMSDTLTRNRKLCTQMDKDSILAIQGITGTNIDLDTILNEDKKETYNMCKAFDDYKLEGYQEGRQVGCQESKMTIIKNMLRHNMAEELIMTLAECTKEAIEEARKRLA